LIRIDHTESQTDNWRKWREDCEAATSVLCARVAAGDPVEVDRALYARRAIKTEHYLAVQGPFGGRCAYCESLLRSNQHGDLDHFRPKSDVRHADDSPVFVEDPRTGRSARHPGYYWLAYDWRNLLPSCQLCNQPSTVDGKKRGKHSRYPVEGPHARTPEEVAHEQPLLIHPAEEDPGTHLRVDIETGLLQGLTQRGTTCIEVFGLNVREQLKESRLGVMDEVRAKVVSALTDSSPGVRARIIAELRGLLEGARGFPSAARALYAELHARLPPPAPVP